MGSTWGRKSKPSANPSSPSFTELVVMEVCPVVCLVVCPVAQEDPPDPVPDPQSKKSTDLFIQLLNRIEDAPVLLQHFHFFFSPCCVNVFRVSCAKGIFINIFLVDRDGC